MAHPDLSLLLFYPMKNSASHGQVKDTIRKKPAKQAEMTRCFKLKRLSSPKQHVLSLWFTHCFWRKWNASLASKKDLWQKKNRFYLAEGACEVCCLLWQAQLLFILQMLILDSVNRCTFLLLGEELHSWNLSRENNPSLPDHPEL